MKPLSTSTRPLPRACGVLLLTLLLPALSACVHAPYRPGGGSASDPAPARDPARGLASSSEPPSAAVPALPTAQAQAQPQAAGFSGKLSVQVPALPGQRINQGGSGSFELVGDARQGQLELSAPTGSLLARVRWSPAGVSLEQAREQRSYDSLDALTLELLGESVPVAALFDWLRGRPWPGAASSALPAPEQGFEQLGWRVQTTRLPEGVLIAEQLGGRAATLRVRLAQED